MSKPMLLMAALAVINLVGVAGLFLTRPAAAVPACQVAYLQPPTIGK